MEIQTISYVYILIGMGVLVLIQTVSLLLLKREIHKIIKKAERYLAYILEDEKETVPVEQTLKQSPKTAMDERQKEQILQEVLGVFFS